MAKFYNNRVKTGKLAGSVFAIRNGETIERAYQPIVANPSTPAQVASRARLKLMSQLSALMAMAVGFAREKTVSPRNIFVKRNYAASSYDTVNSQAVINYNAITLAPATLTLSALEFTQAGGTLNGGLASGDATLDGVVYLILDREADGTMRVASMQNVTTPGADNKFIIDQITLVTSERGEIFAYGYRFLDDNARARYANLVGDLTAANVGVAISYLRGNVAYTDTKHVSTQPA